MNIYENSLLHLLEELRRIDLVVRLSIERWRAEGSDGSDGFQGLYISENEVDSILQAQPYEPGPDADTGLEKIGVLAAEINRKKTESIGRGKELRLHTLSELFHLRQFEVDVLLICLAAELDLRYEKLYSYIQNDVTKKRPTVDLVMRLLCQSVEERLMARDFFSPSAPLIENRLVYLTGDDDNTPLLSKPIKIDERIINFLLGTDGIDRRLRNFSSLVEPKISLEDIVLAEDTKNILMELITHRSVPVIFFFQGPYGTGKKMAAEAVCKELGTRLLVIDSKLLEKDEPSETLKIVLREALLQNSPVYLEGFDSLWKEKDARAINLVRELDRFPGWLFISGEQPREPSLRFKDHLFVNIAFHIPPFESRRQLWESLLNGNASDDIDTAMLAGKFKFSGGQIRDALLTADSIARARKPSCSVISMEDIYLGCRAQSSRNILDFARKAEPRYGWEDIILPKDTKEQLKEIGGYIRHRATVYVKWGFDKKLSLGKGLNILFSGPSGTGKTMAADIIAKDACLDLYKIDLSCVVSKYIGETEKNLSKIFREAETSNAILFFDEADALFGKRSEVRDAHDRYANIETGYLLQKMEEYEGIVILATNLSKNIDDAFLRRMHFVVEFPFPDELQRKRIWTGIFPEEAPLAEDIDYNFISEKLKLAGGNIKNIALTAAFYAAESREKIHMHHIMLAAKREYQKTGKPFLKEDFEPYYKLTEADVR